MSFLLKFSCFCNNWNHVQQKGGKNLVTHNQECNLKKKKISLKKKKCKKKKKF